MYNDVTLTNSEICLLSQLWMTEPVFTYSNPDSFPIRLCTFPPPKFLSIYNEDSLTPQMY